MNVGEVIGDYRLSFRLGEGPCGVVWRATRIDRAQNVILKVIKPDLFEPGRPLQKAFDNLAQTIGALGRVDHPNLMAVVGTARDRDTGLFGLATEYLEARNLDVFPFRSLEARTIVDDPSAFANLLSVMEQLASVVMWLHANRTQHGDIKPSNVLVVPTERGLQVKLTDLIWARAGFGAMTDYQAAYQSPEAIAGQPITHHADQWAVAKIFHQLIVKGSPGRSQTEALTMLPVELLKVIQRCLDSQPTHRFPTMAPVVDALRVLRTQKEHAGDPLRMRAHQIGYSPTTPVSAESISAAIEQEFADTERMPPVRRQASAATPADRAPTRPPRSSERPRETEIVPIEDDFDLEPPKSNAVAWIGIVIASALIAVAGGYLILGLVASDDAVVARAPLTTTTPPIVDEPPPPPPAEAPPAEAPPAEAPAAEAPPGEAPPAEPPPAEPEPPPAEPPVAEAPPSRTPSAGERGVAVAKSCKAGKSSACVEAAELLFASSKTDAVALFERACQLHSMIGCARAADTLLDLGDPKRARRLYEKACDSTHASSCEKLSVLWREGSGGVKNERTADAFVMRACKLGRKSACK